MKTSKDLSFDILQKNFTDIPMDCRLALFVDFSSALSESEIFDIVDKCAENKIGLIIPKTASEDFDFIRPMDYLKTYRTLLDRAELHGIKVAINLEKNIEAAVVRYFDDDFDDSIRSKVILKREYYCSNCEDVKIAIGDEVISVVAIEEKGELIDLRPFIYDGELRWSTPIGNWRICRYFCLEDNESDSVNILNYGKCVTYLNAVLGLFKNSFGHHIGKTLDTIAFSDICFSARNRRNWDEGFDELFERLYGFESAPIYPCLYECANDEQKHFKTLLMDCRSKMLFGGIIKAISDVALANGMNTFGSLSEPNITSCSYVLGDAMMNMSLFPVAKLEKAYLYGVNSLEIAQGAADISGKTIVGCDAFGEYEKLSDDIIYKETATAFARGANMMAVHLPYDGAEIGDYSSFVGRLQGVLRSGDAVSDVAVLYPVWSLHSEVSLFELDIPKGYFEYPETADDIDYMSVINSISFYSGRDLSVVHPEVLRGALDGDEIKVLVLPAAEVVSLENMHDIAAFYDRGGKIIATGALPRRAVESPDGKELKDLVCHIFGSQAYDENITGDFIHNKNDRGGEAYFLYSTGTGVDRGMLVPSARILEALDSFDIAYDVYIENMPRMDCTGALNTSYPEYKQLGLSESVRGGGMMSYIHKKCEGFDVYYFTNANNSNYCGNIHLKGNHSIESWNARNGEISAYESESIILNGSEYTKINVSLDSGESILFVSKNL
ncbi:MAG: hypothetical protein IKJ91_11745 [Clostridia bacterium]|nr:hypothetical protein [Clostridia bacterium]